MIDSFTDLSCPLSRWRAATLGHGRLLSLSAERSGGEGREPEPLDSEAGYDATACLSPLFCQLPNEKLDEYSQLKANIHEAIGSRSAVATSYFHSQYSECVLPSASTEYSNNTATLFRRDHRGGIV